MKLLVATSTFPISDDDKVPAFVKDQVIEFKKQQPDMEIVVLAPHNYYGDTAARLKPNSIYTEARFHYFRPYRFELLAGRAIMPALKQNRLLYFQIPFFAFFQFWALLRQTQKFKPDLIYAHWFMPQAISAAMVSKITGIPFVFTTHASDVAVLYKVPFTKRLIRWVCRKAQAYTAVSHRTADKLMYAFSDQDWQDNYKQKLSIIPMGVNIELSSLSSAEIASVRKNFDLPSDKKLFVFIGRLAEKKGVTYLLNAIANLDKDVSHGSHFVIAGDGQLMDPLKDEAHKLQLENVSFTGYVHGKDKDALIQMADYSVFPSIIDSMNDSEGFPVTIMESLAAGKVVLGSDVSGAETIFDDGHDGFVFKQKSSDDLRVAIERAYRMGASEINKMKKSSLALAKRYSWGKIAKEHIEVLERSLK